MRTTRKNSFKLDVFRPASALVFASLVILWVVVALGLDWPAFPGRGVARLAGYVAFAAMMVPYLHVVRRCFRYRRAGAMTRWLRWHIGASYLAFAMVLLHSRGQAAEPLTLVLLWLTWIVMISGAVGFYGQKLLYYLLPRVVPRELGLERLEPERAQVLATAEELVHRREIKQSPEIIQRFCTTAVEQCFTRPFTFWHPRLSGGDDELSENWYLRTRTFADACQSQILQQFWDLIQVRRAMDLEYRLHQIGRLWLFVHGPAAWALLFLMIEHAIVSMWYGGF